MTETYMSQMDESASANAKRLPKNRKSIAQVEEKERAVAEAKTDKERMYTMMASSEDRARELATVSIR